MFNMNTVGRKIAQLRKNKNLTQSELADQLGVTYQAVSNWERGDTMPDIAKLGELSAIFDVSIDELLENHRSIKIVKDIIEQKPVNLSELNSEELGELLPLIKPKQFDDSFKDIKDSDWQMLIALAPFLDEEALKETIINKLNDNPEDNEELTSVAPFLSGESLSQIISIIFPEHLSFDNLVSLSPFLSDITLKQIVIKSVNEKQEVDFASVAPFLSNESLNEVIDLMIESEKYCDDICEVAPFLSSAKLDQVLYQLYQKKGISEAIDLVPFASSHMLEEIAKDLIVQKKYEDLTMIAPFINASSVIKRK